MSPEGADGRIRDAERALRLARAILSDVMLYNPRKVRLGIEHDDLFERLHAELEEGRVYFDSRVSLDVARKSNAWGRALVDVLVFRSGSVPSRIW